MHGSVRVESKNLIAYRPRERQSSAVKNVLEMEHEAKVSAARPAGRAE
jgi:hypothetical protein